MLISRIIHIRFRQLFRLLLGVGFIRASLIIIFFSFLCLFLFINPGLRNFSGTIVVVTVLFLLTVHMKRSDKLFLRINFINHRLIFFSEYLFLTLPVIFFLLLGNVLFLPLLIIAIAGIVFVDSKTKRHSIHSKIPAFIPSSCFEWKAGFRQTFSLLLLLWIAGMGLCFILWSVPVIIFITGIITTGFYEKQESLQMIMSYEKGPKKFLLLKVAWQFKLYTIFVLPLIIAFLIFHPAQWYIPAIIYVIVISLQAYQVFNKYAFYEPQSGHTASQIFTALGVLGAIIPVFLPVIWLLTLMFYFRSKEKLNFYLNDYN